MDRVRTSPGVDIVCLTTSTHSDDAVLCDVARRNGIEASRGSEDDKLQRYLDAARALSVDFAVVVDGDDVFCDPTVIGRIIAEHKARGGDFIIVDKLPVGVTGFGIAIDALEKVVMSKKEQDTEVWGQYFTRRSDLTSKLLSPPPEWSHPEWRMTLDYAEDLAFFERVFDELYRPGHVFAFDEIVSLLVAKPEIAAINAGVQKIYEQNIARTIREAR